MPTFKVYKDGTEAEKLQGANLDKLKEMIWSNETHLSEFIEMYEQFKYERELAEKNKGK